MAAYNMPGGTISVCTGEFYSTGGIGGGYASNEDITTTFCSDSGNCVQVAFSAFDTETDFDILEIYDGADISASLIGAYSGSNSPGVVTSSAGCLTFRFVSDGSITSTGWAAAISCVTCPPPPPLPPLPPHSACGYNAEGQLGVGDINQRDTPTQPGTGTPWVELFAAGVLSLFGIKSDGTLWAWGQNGAGQLGLGDATQRESPVQVGTDVWSKVVARDEQAVLGIKADGTLWAWGSNLFGQLGVGDKVQRESPTQVGVDTWASVTLGSMTAFGIRTDGTMWAWGGNTSGILGLGIGDAEVLTPMQIGSATWKFVVACSAYSAHAIRSDDTLWAWGEGTDGQLGLGSTASKGVPTQVGVDTWSSVSRGVGNFALGIKSNGTLWAWGFNLNGQLGVGDTTSRLYPVQVGVDSWGKIYAGAESASGIKSDGTLWAWGTNYDGRLGLGDTTQRTTPAQVGSDTWSTAFPGGGIKPDGTLWVWGPNDYGSLGVGDTLQRESPVQFGSEPVVGALVVMGVFTFAMYPAFWTAFKGQYEA